MDPPTSVGSLRKYQNGENTKEDVLKLKNKGSFQINMTQLNFQREFPFPLLPPLTQNSRHHPAENLNFFFSNAGRQVRSSGERLGGLLDRSRVLEGPATIRMDNGGALPGLSPLSPTPLSPSSVQVRTPSPPLSFFLLVVVVSPDARTRVHWTALHPTSPSRFSTRRRRTWRGESKSST